MLSAVEVDFDLMWIFDEGELDVVDVFSFDHLTELLEEVPLGHLSFNLTHDDANTCYFTLEVLFLEFEKGLQCLVVSPLAYV